MEYVLKSAAILTLFYLVYKIFLEKETFFQSIRAYLLLGLVSSLLLPAVKLKEYIYVESVQSLEGSAFTNSADVVSRAPVFGLEQMLIWLYLAGVGFLGVRFLIRLGSLYLYLKKRPKTKEGSYWMMPSSDDTAPFSFFRYIVYPHNRFHDEELEQVLAHEKAHSDQFHSLDVLFSELICVILWFNPFVWLYHKEVQKNLEYLADAGLRISQKPNTSYEYLLLKTIQPSYQVALTSSFYQSLIKKRIQMLQKSKSKNIMYLKFVVILPLLVAFVINFNTEIIAQQKSDSKNVQIEEEMEVIDKDFSKSDLDKLQARLLKEGLEFKYRKLKYNDANEIIGIELSVSNDKGNKAKLSESGDGPISPISIRYDRMNGTIALGNMNGIHDEIHKNIVKEVHKEIILDRDGEKEVIIIGGDGSNHFSNEDVDVRVTSDGNVWVSESGESGSSKHIQVIEVDEDASGATKIMIKKGDGDDEDVDVKIKTISRGDNDFVFVNDGDGKPLIIMDGKEVTDGKMEDLDHEEIETIEVLKGSKAVEKYGEKARDGVVIITSKK